MTRFPPPVGTTAWERAGGPPLSTGQKLSLLAGAALVIATHYAGKLRWKLTGGHPPQVDLADWAPPDSQAAREAERFLREVASPQMVGHGLRTWWFTAVQCELAGARGAIDREALYVGAVLHDVGFFRPPAPGEHCFTVSSAREARRIAAAAGWDESRQDKMALTITSNLNPSVPLDGFGPESHFISLGGRVEVIAQEWRIHPDNLRQILALHPRKGFAADALAHVGLEARRRPHGRFACLSPMFPLLVKWSSFSCE